MSKSGCSDYSKRSGLVWLLRLPGSSFCGFSPWSWLCRSPQRWRRSGGRCDARPDGQQQVSTTGGGQRGRYRGSSWWSFLNVSLVPICHGSQWRVYNAGLSLAGDAFLSFWRHALPRIPVTSATWPLYWWFLPDQGPQHWRRSYSSERWGWCRDIADGSAHRSITEFDHIYRSIRAQVSK